jgi:ribosomal protein S12 methylthiotransferase
LLETISRYPNLCPYFDIPIQHAADGVLKRMGRRYTGDDLERLFGRIRSVIPQAALRTTVLTGFPGETEADVDRLADFIQQIRFDHLGVFCYSDATDLLSHGLSRHVPDKTAQARMDRLMALQREISEDKLVAFLGSILPVLVEKEAEPGIYVTRTMFQAPEVDGCVLLRSQQPLPPGIITTVRIVETMEYDLIGEPVY